MKMFGSWQFAIFLSLAIFFTSTLTLARFDHKSFNVIDNCWRSDPRWRANRPQLANCAIGFSGKMTNNIGKELKKYRVWDPSDDAVEPKKGTLRYAATIFKGKIWITFKRNMNITLQKPILISSFTAIDGRGVNVNINGQGCLFVYEATDVIIHGVTIHGCKSQGSGDLLAPRGLIRVENSEGDGIRVVNSSKIWIDHNTLYSCEDGLVDVTVGSTDITISNNWFRNHDAVILLGHADEYTPDKHTKVTIAFNRFGPNCYQRMPRVRYGYAHVVNNLYQGWNQYALGGSMDPVILSQSNYFIAQDSEQKVVIWSKSGNPLNFYTLGDYFENEASFLPINIDLTKIKRYTDEDNFPVMPATYVKSLLLDSSGALKCKGVACWNPQRI